MDENSLLGHVDPITSGIAAAVQGHGVIPDGPEHCGPRGNEDSIFGHCAKRVDEIVRSLNTNMVDRYIPVRQEDSTPRGDGVEALGDATVGRIGGAGRLLSTATSSGSDAILLVTIFLPFVEGLELLQHKGESIATDGGGRVWSNGAVIDLAPTVKKI